MKIPVSIDTLGLLFALLVVLVLLLLWRLHRDPAVSFNLLDLLLENGRVSKAACVMMGAFGVTTWQMVYFTLENRMTEGFLGIYVGAWIAPVVTRLVVNGAPGPLPDAPLRVPQAPVSALLHAGEQVRP